mgnify:CR=1 FL=1
MQDAGLHGRTAAVIDGAGEADPADPLARIAGGVDVALTDYDVEPFDPTQAPDADVTLPIEQRAPGGLGIHLTRRLVEELEYRYAPERREARISFRKSGDPVRRGGA